MVGTTIKDVKATYFVIFFYLDILMHVFLNLSHWFQIITGTAIHYRLDIAKFIFKIETNKVSVGIIVSAMKYVRVLITKTF